MYIVIEMGIKGFTILEIIIVIVVIGIITTISIVTFSRYSSHHRIIGIAQTINQDFRLARQLAREKGENYIVYFRVNEKDYQIYQQGSENSPYEIKKLPVGIRYGFNSSSTPEPEPGVGKPADGVGLTQNRATFTPYGTVNSGVVYITDGQEVYALVIHQIGTTRLWSWNGNNWE